MSQTKGKSGVDKLNLQHMKIVADALRSGDISQTARKYGITQPGVSFHINKFEDAFGVELLRRDGNRFYPSPEGHGTVRGLMARPAAATAPLPAVLVVHENRGLNPYIEDVVRRTAKAGFLALGPDGLTPLGGYPGNDDEGREMQKQLDPVKLMADFFAGYDYLATHPGSTGRVGAVGFCYGGGVCNALAVAYPNLKAAVPFYGRQPQSADVPRIQAALMLHYAGLDERVNAGWPEYEKALQANGKTYRAYIYEGANHGFHNDTTPRYDPAAAELAWSRTLDFLHTRLGPV